MRIFIGTDIEAIERFRSLVNDKKKLKSIFSTNEYQYAINKLNPEQSFAGIWCAKEAVVKSCGEIKLLNVRDVEIICSKNCPPRAIIKNEFLKNKQVNITVSISHTKDYANATSIVYLE